MNHHYVYQIISMTPNEEGVCRIYSGLRSCECLPEEDTEYMGSGHAIRGAIEKYGRDKFMKLIIGKFDTREEAHDCETEWLEKQFNFHGRDWKRFSKFNYNLRLNENSRDGFYSSPETRAKMSEAGIGRQHSDDTKKKLSVALMGKIAGENNPNFGKTGEKCSFFKGLSIGKNENNLIIVFCGTADMKDRCFHQGAISNVINGKRPHHKGFVFIRTDDPDQLRTILNTATFYDDVSKERIEEFLQG